MSQDADPKVGSRSSSNKSRSNQLRADLARAERALHEAREAWARHARHGPQRVEGLTRLDLALFFLRGSIALLSERSLGALFTRALPRAPRKKTG